MLTHIDLFSGIGGFSLAAKWAGFKTIVFCETDRFRQVLLQKRFKARFFADADFKRLEGKVVSAGRPAELYRKPVLISDIRKFPGRAFRGATVLTGGFPCQPFSVAGKRLGKKDDRYLWEEMHRVIKEGRPRWVIGENVTGIISLALPEVLADLENENYSVQVVVIPACAIGAPHRRDRVWIIAHSKNRGNSEAIKNTDSQRRCGWGENLKQILGSQIPEAQAPRPNWSEDWSKVAACLCGVDDGLPARVDGFELSRARHRVERLKALGEAIVPQIVYVFFSMIGQVEGEWNNEQ